MAEGEEGERPPSESFWGVSGSGGATGRLVDSGLAVGLNAVVSHVAGLDGGLRAIDSRTSRCSASICLSYSAHMLAWCKSVSRHGLDEDEVRDERV